MGAANLRRLSQLSPNFKVWPLLWDIPPYIHSFLYTYLLTFLPLSLPTCMLHVKVTHQIIRTPALPAGQFQQRHLLDGHDRPGARGLQEVCAWVDRQPATGESKSSRPTWFSCQDRLGHPRSRRSPWASAPSLGKPQGKPGRIWDSFGSCRCRGWIGNNME